MNGIKTESMARPGALPLFYELGRVISSGKDIHEAMAVAVRVIVDNEPARRGVGLHIESSLLPTPLAPRLRETQ